MSKAALETAHRLIMQAAEGPGLALVKGKASRTLLVESVKKLRQAADVIEGVL